MRSLFINIRGAGALEFTVVAPVLAFIALGMIDGWSMASSSLSMHAAIQAGAKYLIQGGTNTASVKAIALSEWSSAPADGVVSVTKTCSCSGVAGVCTGLCATTFQPPQTTFSIQATGTWSAPFSATFMPLLTTLSETQVVRIR